MGLSVPAMRSECRGNGRKRRVIRVSRDSTDFHKVRVEEAQDALHHASFA